LLSDNPDWLQVAQPGETDITILENDGKAFWQLTAFYIYKTLRRQKAQFHAVFIHIVAILAICNFAGQMLLFYKLCEMSRKCN
jgi:hypothetical protein